MTSALPELLLLKFQLQALLVPLITILQTQKSSFQYLFANITNYIYNYTSALNTPMHAV